MERVLAAWCVEPRLTHSVILGSFKTAIFALYRLETPSIVANKAAVVRRRDPRSVVEAARLTHPTRLDRWLAACGALGGPAAEVTQAPALARHQRSLGDQGNGCKLDAQTDRDRSRRPLSASPPPDQPEPDLNRPSVPHCEHRSPGLRLCDQHVAETPIDTGPCRFLRHAGRPSTRRRGRGCRPSQSPVT